MFNIVLRFVFYRVVGGKLGDFLSNNIAVDPNVVCHTERSEVSLWNAIMLLMPDVKLNKFYSTRPIATFKSECCEVSLFLRFHFVRKKKASVTLNKLKKKQW